MTIIDRYIIANTNRPAATVAKELGVSESFVKCRRVIITEEPVLDTSNYVSDEMTALLSLIEERKEGWAVDIARQRIAALEKLAAR